MSKEGDRKRKRDTLISITSDYDVLVNWLRWEYSNVFSRQQDSHACQQRIPASVAVMPLQSTHILPLFVLHILIGLAINTQQ